MRFNRFAPLAPFILIAACVPRAEPPAQPSPPTAPAPAPAPSPLPTPSPVPTQAGWENVPQTPGDWTYANSIATFGLPGQPRLTFACTGGTVRITLPGASSGLLTVRTETATRALQATGGVASLAARDSLLDAMAFSKGRFAIEGAGQPLYVPAWPEISRVIEDCR